MKKIFVALLVVVASSVLAYTYPSPGARAFAIDSIVEANKREVHITSRLDYAEAKRGWVAAQMGGRQGFLQVETLRTEITQLKRERDRAVSDFNERYALFRFLRLI